MGETLDWDILSIFKLLYRACLSELWATGRHGDMVVLPRMNVQTLKGFPQSKGMTYKTVHYKQCLLIHICIDFWISYKWLNFSHLKEPCELVVNYDFLLLLLVVKSNSETAREIL